MFSNPKKRVLKTLEAYRTALKNYRKSAGEFPNFIMEKPAPMMPNDALKECKVYPHRYDLLAAMPKGGSVAEVGTLHGDFARKILDDCSPEKLTLFDRDFNRVRDDVKSDPRVEQRRGNSSALMLKEADGSFDWIYIDAGHTYAEVKKDRDASVPKLKDRGVLVFNDYLVWSPMLAEPYGVVTAVNELVVDGGWDVVGLALTPHGYWDIAIQKQ